ncbi:MAG TPA: hypothetical protein VGM53_33280 [Streptosporangiaceae bacterium]|jgi:hypothetical protein
MYMSDQVLRSMHQERLDEAQRHREAYRNRALNRAVRREARAERQMSRARQARVEAAGLRRRLEAEL